MNFSSCFFSLLAFLQADFSACQMAGHTISDKRRRKSPDLAERLTSVGRDLEDHAARPDGETDEVEDTEARLTVLGDRFEKSLEA